MSYTYSKPPGRTRQQRDRNPRLKQQWNSEEEDMDTVGASGYSSHHSVHHPRRDPQHSPLSTPHEHTSQHQSSQQENPLQQYVYRKFYLETNVNLNNAVSSC